MAHFAVLCLITGLASACRSSAPRHSGGGGRPPSGSTGNLLTGCFYSNPRSAHRVSLCLGPPDLHPGRYTLHEKETVPDQSFIKTCEGGYGMNGAALILRPDRCTGFDVNEQLGQTSSPAPERAPEVHAWVRNSNAIGVSLRRQPEILLLRVR